MQILGGLFSAVSTPLIARVGAFFRIFRYLKIGTPSHFWNPKWKTAWRKNLPENPKENERTRPHGKVEKVETIGDAWNSA